MTYYILVCGGRDFQDWDRFQAVMEEERIAALQACPIGETITLCVLTGDAHGADAMGKNWARNNGHKFIEEKADWLKYNLASGPMRNATMAAFLATKLPYTRAVAFWDGFSTGTEDMLKKATRMYKKAGVLPPPVRIEYY